MISILLVLPMLLYSYWAIRASAVLKVKREAPDLSANLSASIIIPFKNELKNLEDNLQIWQDLLNTMENVDLILVDDNSTDGSLEFLQQHLSRDTSVLSSDGQGKKAALKTAIETSHADVLVFTDADCRPSEGWLRTMLSPFISPEVKMALGPVIYYKDDSPFNAFCTLDFLSLMVSTEAAVRLGRPIMANGANMAIRREVRQELDSEIRKDIASGDDVFLLHSLVRKYGSESVQFVSSPKAVVSTKPPANLMEFFRQRIRWGGKSKHYQDKSAQWLAAIVFLANVSLIIAFVVSPLWALGLFLIKFLLDGILLRKATQLYGRRDSLVAYPFQALVYSVYISVLGVLSQFVKTDWKD